MLKLQSAPDCCHTIVKQNLKILKYLIRHLQMCSWNAIFQSLSWISEHEPWLKKQKNRGSMEIKAGK